MKSRDRQQIMDNKSGAVNFGQQVGQRTVPASVWPYQREPCPQRAAVAESLVSSSGRGRWWRQRYPSPVKTGTLVGYVSPSSTSLTSGTATGRSVLGWKVLVRDRPELLRVRCLPRASTAVGAGAAEDASDAEEAERSRWRELFREIILLNEALLKPALSSSSAVPIVGRRSPTPALLPMNWTCSDDAFRTRLNEINGIMLQRWRRKRGLGGGGGLWGLLGFGPWATDGTSPTNGEPPLPMRVEPDTGSEPMSWQEREPNKERDPEPNHRAPPLRWLERLWDFIWEQVGLPTIESPPEFVLDAVRQAAVANWERELAEWNPFWLSEGGAHRHLETGTPGLGARSSTFLGSASVSLARVSKPSPLASSASVGVSSSMAFGVSGCRAEIDAKECPQSGVEAGIGGCCDSTSTTASSLPARLTMAPEPTHTPYAVEESDSWPMAVMSHTMDAYPTTSSAQEVNSWSAGHHQARTVQKPTSDSDDCFLISANEVSVLSYISKDEEFPIYELVAVETPYGPAIVVFENAEDAYDTVMSMDETRYPHIIHETVDKDSALGCCYFEGSHLLWMPNNCRLPADVKTVPSFARKNEPNALRAPLDWHVPAAEKLYPDNDLSNAEAIRRQQIQAEKKLLQRGFILEPLPGPGQNQFFALSHGSERACGLLFRARPREAPAAANDIAPNGAALGKQATSPIT